LKPFDKERFLEALVRVKGLFREKNGIQVTRRIVEMLTAGKPNGDTSGGS
jgi:hypothetical protein